MIKGIPGLGYHSKLVVPIIENTAHEEDLTGSLEKAMDQYPDTCAVLVRRHGVYVWGQTWEMAKTQAECYDYLFSLAVRMCSMNMSTVAKE
ncbi:Methylthioribulose-1-phosphate dehydratase [Neolecta irregularis DAH-3]|uniref:Methylthioribulose-1-phosphate dehydratase n=1 Tax=Neolecta irregularis (strain DAH-3) TaxID=1198029 RepID=A0A1U7LX51_NEOID|nr:Methylthioribulose-1-phosphate dehydratase [Neolecta irregularis DAH-3]|eukprot:OLL27101.1 Methylthioribulose-1-phosphate dehydratase [Neolecta irregularis DAH-3]